MTPRPVVSRRAALRSALGALALGGAAPLLASSGATPAQIEGPFFPKVDQADTDADLAGQALNAADRLLQEVPEPERSRLVVAFQSAPPAATVFRSVASTSSWPGSRHAAPEARAR